MGPRGLGPIKQNCLKNLLVRVYMFPNDILGFWTCRNLFASPVGFQTTFRDFGHVKNLFVSPCRFPNDILEFWTCNKPLCQPSRFPNDILEFYRHIQNLFASPVGFQMTFWNSGHVKTSLLAQQVSKRHFGILDI